MINNDNYIVIQGFMTNELKLKGNELLVYAIIYGFSQCKEQKFTGSLQYLADWTNSSKQGVQKNLKSLLKKNLIKKEDKIINSVKFVTYYTTELHRVYNSVSKGMQLSCTNNIYNNINIKEEEEEKEKNIIDFYEENFGLLSSHILLELKSFLNDGLEEELIIEAMKDSINYNAKNWNYIKSILNNCINKKIYKLDQYKLEKVEFKNKKSKTYNQPKKIIEYNTDFSEYDKYAK